MGRLDGITLSILTLTIPRRREMFNAIWDKLEKQAEGKPVQMISLSDNYKISTGQKRQYLLDMAAGKYVTYVDDDDDVADFYVDEILKAAEENPDVITYPVYVSINGGQEGLVNMSLQYAPKLGEPLAEYKPPVTNRPPHELAIWRTELARKATFADWWGGEDYDWAEQLWPLAKTEKFVDKVLYFYRFSNTLNERQRGNKSSEWK